MLSNRSSIRGSGKRSGIVLALSIRKSMQSRKKVATSSSCSGSKSRAIASSPCLSMKRLMRSSYATSTSPWHQSLFASSNCRMRNIILVLAWRKACWTTDSFRDRHLNGLSSIVSISAITSLAISTLSGSGKKKMSRLATACARSTLSWSQFSVSSINFQGGL